VRVGQLVALRGAVALAIGQVFEDRRHGVLLRIAWQPKTRGEPAAIGERDEDILDLARLARELGDDVHDSAVSADCWRWDEYSAARSRMPVPPRLAWRNWPPNSKA